MVERAPILNRWSLDQLVTGVETPAWLRILAHNRWGISPAYLHRLAWVTGLSLPTSILGLVERAVYGRRIRDYPIDPTPLFVLGHWRSGTTHLHNLLGRDPGHTFCTVYQAVFPTTFLTTGTIGPALLKNALPETRTYDQVKHGWFEAAEDEIALLKLTAGLSFYGALMFPDRFREYERYIDFATATEAERTRWRHALGLLVKKLMIDSGGKRVIVKSCPHSARIPLILDRFPDARFVHIHRHPARVFRSMMHMRSKVDWENYFQVPTSAFVHDRQEQTAELGQRVFTRLIEDRALIPPENLIEISYDELCGNEVPVMRRIYDAFGLDWAAYEPELQAYLTAVGDYQPNALEMPDDLLDYVYDRWRLVYDTYGYPRDYP